MPSKKIPVILLENIDGLGSAGDIIKVAEGFARNNLFPEGKAALADDKAISRKKQDDQARQQAAETKLQAIQDQAQALEGTELTIPARVKDGSEIYGRITPTAIAKSLKEEAHIEVKGSDISISKAITALGTYDAIVALSREVEAKIKVTVISDTPPEESDDE